MEVKQGQVQWFDRHTGYGFLSYSKDKDNVFVHQSQLKTEVDQFRYLVPGEYVEFRLESRDDNKVSAVNVTGINGGKLMCEVRRDFKLSKPQSD